MATLLSESACINDVDFKGLVVSSLNGAFLMSLVEESQVEHDDERLNSIMRSLEAEINPEISMDCLSSGVGLEALDCEYYENDIELFSVEELDGEGFFEELENDPKFRFVDEEIVGSSSSDDDDMNWSIEIMENEMESILGFEGFRECYQICNETMLEDNVYGSLW